MPAFMLPAWQTIILETCCCIAVLLLPSSLLLWTVNVVYRRRSFRDSGPLIVLNIALGVTILILMWISNIGTLYVIVLMSYKLVLALLSLAGVLGLYIWAEDRYMYELSPDEQPEPTTNS